MLSASLIFFILVYKYLYSSRELHENNQYINSAINVKKPSANFGNLFQSTLGMPGHALPHPKKLNWSKCSFDGCLTTWKIWEKSEIYTSNSFQHIKNLKSLQTDWPNSFSPPTRESGFTDKRFLAESQRQLCCII